MTKHAVFTPQDFKMFSEFFNIMHDRVKKNLKDINPF